MNKKMLIVGMAITIGFGLSGCDEEVESTSKRNTLVQTAAFKKAETDIIYKYMKAFPKNVQISIGKIGNGQIYYYGAHNQNDSVVTVDNKSSGFEIGSISKVFTSTLLAQFILEEKVSLNEDIAGRLPFALHDGISISYKQLANHTSGLARDPDDLSLSDVGYHEEKDLDYTDIARYLEKDLALKYDQNTFHYSNVAVGALGYMLTRIENKPYEQLLQERILSPLSMHSTTTIRGEGLVPALAISHDEPIPLAFKSAGGIISTVEDMYQFALASFDLKEAYALTQTPTFRIDESTQIGLGWHLMHHKDTGLDFIFHGGTTMGYRSFIVLDVEHKNGLIILSNLPIESNEHAIVDLAMELARENLGD